MLSLQVSAIPARAIRQQPAQCRLHGGGRDCTAAIRFRPGRRSSRRSIAEGRIGGEKVLLIKPQTFMNLSGQAVGEALRFYKLEPSDLTVFYDELDLAPGKVRVKTGGGAGGHNGIRSLDGHIGKEYRRVRIGIGHPGVKEMVTPHVLGDFAKADHEWLDPLLDAIADNAELAGQGRRQRLHEQAEPCRPGCREDRTRQGTQQGAGESRAEPPQRRARATSARRGRKRPAVKVPETGPMAAMLKRLFGQGMSCAAR